MTDPEKCPICLEPFVSRASISCGHAFCHQCILEWSKNTNSCPLCKKEFEKILGTLSVDRGGASTRSSIIGKTVTYVKPRKLKADYDAEELERLYPDEEESRTDESESEEDDDFSNSDTESSESTVSDSSDSTSSRSSSSTSTTTSSSSSSSSSSDSNSSGIKRYIRNKMRSRRRRKLE